MPRKPKPAPSIASHMLDEFQPLPPPRIQEVKQCPWCHRSMGIETYDLHEPRCRQAHSKRSG
jgi:hypothetical protein